MEFLVSVLEIAVLAMLVVAMIFATKGIKEKKNPQLRKEHYQKAARFAAGYLMLNGLRLLLKNAM